MCKLIKSASHTGYNLTFIVGDFNIKRIDWEDMKSTEGPNVLSTKFLESIEDSFMYQHVDRPIRHRVAQDSSTLDFVLTVEEQMVENINYLSPL